MDFFEIGSCFRSYKELMQKLKDYSQLNHSRYTTKDCRLIKDQLADGTAKERLVYTDLKLICVHGRTVKPQRSELKRKRTEKNVKTGCPAYFRLKLIHSGIALQIVALNVKHNHPLEPESEAKPKVIKTPKKRGRKKKVKPIKEEAIKEEEDDEIKQEGLGSDDEVVEGLRELRERVERSSSTSSSSAEEKCDTSNSEKRKRIESESSEED